MLWFLPGLGWCHYHSYHSTINRHYYYGNEFVYGVPPRHDNGRHQGWDRHDDRRDYRRDDRRDHHYHDRDRGQNVVIIQSAPRRW